MTAATRERNVEFARHTTEEVCNQRNSDALDKIASEEYEEYDPVLAVMVQGRDAVKNTIHLDWLGTYDESKTRWREEPSYCRRHGPKTN